MKINNARIFSVLLIIFSLIFNGCTLYGLGIGAIVDSRTSDSEIIDRDEYKSIEINRDITVYQKDRSIRKGKFIETSGNYLIIETKFGLESVSMQDITNIEAESKKNAMWKGLGIGFALDIVYVALVAISIAAEGN
ncbi:MAG: hypothetical protein IIB40_03545 [Candidatus Marinimicrobia bacterium]|nr:hypothetical protein [Candidatus Neomarinimicrobiota bacterium]